MSSFATHTVQNQVPPLEDYSLYDTDPALREAVRREGADNWAGDLAAHGAWLGRAQTLAAGAEANRCPPRLVSYDPGGHRIDHVEFHPAWNLLMSGILARGLHSRAWAQPVPGAQVARAAAYLMQGQVEAGTLCPTTMTFAAVPLLQREPAGAIDFAGQWLPALYSREFDAADAPLAAKRSALIGMGLTEKQGGSDLRAVSTRAVPLGAPGRGNAYELVGHKWFFSVPQADAHLVLAQTDEGLSCFFVPRWIPDGPRNAIRVRRLKDKLGNRSNASGEVEFEGAWGVMVGESGRGLAVLLEMAATTRLDCVLGSAALLRQALVQSLHHAQHRQAFGKPLIEQPLMRNVLADLALESEAAMVLALRLARAVDARADAPARALVRVGTPAAKLWICKRAIHAVAECMEVWGGNGYVEEGPMPRIYRETPVNSIWEGSGNVMALDVLRALQREPEALPALEQEFALAAGRHRAFDEALARWRALLADQAQAEFQARRVAGGLARLWQAALLIQHAPEPVAQAFVASRLHADGGIFGELAAGADTQAILSRAWPAVAC
ncbi:isovaleryl-CoA dehydrogenase [Achromobacter marplatensis]|uniref:Acyl-CoA dehydrogenase n=1 Tax=Achromobacter marplatensis TaxID=470868 RepID=A0ABX9GFX6_9BURK|nr:isovaleryl-CoA dehydrogenase [Achromobacter marplatensis]OWT60537.1 isovaleryl-CoA dehydrogenase [Achromobacter marplatensis]RBP23250.1 putative acyl-CoA dehydrogenase [Achromobacter marplatensis]CAB3710058.1 Putative acyl-CoA dehydrogenase AidB [Achromobacter marplatensis]